MRSKFKARVIFITLILTVSLIVASIIGSLYGLIFACIYGSNVFWSYAKVGAVIGGIIFIAVIWKDAYKEMGHKNY